MDRTGLDELYLHGEVPRGSLGVLLGVALALRGTLLLLLVALLLSRRLLLPVRRGLACAAGRAALPLLGLVSCSGSSLGRGLALLLLQLLLARLLLLGKNKKCQFVL